ncbi:hypothetical protein KBD20_00900 [Candidatus Saccharibacteria bacterium]|nr:hypothetical protein [Candidatus Saccharibacteria bacterium]
MILNTKQLMLYAGLILVAVFSVTTVLGSHVYAQSSPSAVSDFCGEAQDSAFCDERSKGTGGTDPVNNSTSPILGPSSIFYKIIQTLTVLTGAVSVIMIIVGGFRYVVSGGDSNATKGAKDTILYAVIGLVVVIFAQTIITFVLSRL